MPPTIPLTLHLKSSTSTLFLSLPPSASLTTLSSTLFTALTSTSQNLPPSLQNIPSESHLRYALPKDIHDLKKGYHPLTDFKSSLQALGIKDNAVVVFKVVEDAEDDGDEEGVDGWDVKWVVDEEDSQASQT